MLTSCLCFLRLVVFDRSLDSIFCEHGTMELYWWQFQMGSDIGIFNVDGILDGHALEELCGIAAGCDGWAATEGLEYSLLDHFAVFSYLDLELHDVSACWGANKSGTYGVVILVELSNVSWVFVMVEHFSVISEWSNWSLHEGEGWLHHHSCISESCHSHGSKHTLLDHFIKIFIM